MINLVSDKMDASFFLECFKGEKLGPTETLFFKDFFFRELHEKYEKPISWERVFTKTKFNKELSAIDALHQENNKLFKCTIGSNSPFIPSPTNELLTLIAQKYEKKYDIDIRIVENTSFQRSYDKDGKELYKVVEKDLIEFIKTINSSDDQTLGIVFSPSLLYHAVPIILQVKNEKMMALILDVGGNEIDYDSNCRIKSILNSNGVEARICRNARLADLISCRTGAIITLRNALTDLKNLGNPLLFDRINDVNQPMSDQEFDAPACWVAAHDQIFKERSGDDLNENKPTRVCRGKRLQSLREARAMNMKPSVEYKITFTPLNSDLELAARVLEATKVENLSATSQTTNEGLCVSVSWKEIRNTYMVEKAIRIYQELIEQLNINQHVAEQNDQALSFDELISHIREICGQDDQSWDLLEALLPKIKNKYWHRIPAEFIQKQISAILNDQVPPKHPVMQIDKNEAKIKIEYLIYKYLLENCPRSATNKS
jgi:hypothetical protein